MWVDYRGPLSTRGDLNIILYVYIYAYTGQLQTTAQYSLHRCRWWTHCVWVEEQFLLYYLLIFLQLFDHSYALQSIPEIFNQHLFIEVRVLVRDVMHTSTRDTMSSEGFLTSTR